MTLEFRDHQILVISPGSSVTQIQMGLSESLMPPAFEIPTVVHKDKPTGKYSMNPTSESEPVKPIVKGQITDEAAFFYLLKMVYKSVNSADGLPPALFLVASLSWTRRQLERLTRYMFEEAGVPSLSISLQGTVVSYAFAASECLVIDIGLDKTEISAVLNFETNRQGSVVVDVGGSTINQELQKLLPQLTADQIESLKTSNIYEVLSESQARAGGSSGDALMDEEEGVVDIAAIVSSGRTREILERREKQKHGEVHEASNLELEQNSFTDRNGNVITIGQERFMGCDVLMNSIVDAIADVIYNLQPKDQEKVFENVIFTGKGSLVQGLRAELGSRIEHQYVIRPRGPAGVIASAEEVETPSQGPTSFTMSKFPDHFPEWKNRKWEDFTMLGAQIGAKQVFTTGIEGLFVSRQDYNEVGPSCVWEICS